MRALRTSCSNTQPRVRSRSSTLAVAASSMRKVRHSVSSQTSADACSQYTPIFKVASTARRKSFWARITRWVSTCGRLAAFLPKCLLVSQSSLARTSKSNWHASWRSWECRTVPFCRRVRGKRSFSVRPPIQKHEFRADVLARRWHWSTETIRQLQRQTTTTCLQGHQRCATIERRSLRRLYHQMSGLGSGETHETRSSDEAPVDHGWSQNPGSCYAFIACVFSHVWKSQPNLEGIVTSVGHVCSFIVVIDNYSEPFIKRCQSQDRRSVS